MRTQLIPGLYGKLPSLGDFVARSLPSDFICLWDDWIQRSLRTSQEQMGDQWLDCYLTCPIYRFILSPGTCGEKSAVGVMMPSVDNVGRYFPFTLVALVNEETPMAHLLLTQPNWFSRLEELALSVLKDAFDLIQFEQQLSQLRLTVSSSDDAILFAYFKEKSADGPHFFTTGVETTNKLASAYGYFCSRLLVQNMPTFSLWSTNGSNEIAPSLTAYHGLPPADAYIDFISGLLLRTDCDQQTVKRPSSDRVADVEPSTMERGELG